MVASERQKRQRVVQAVGFMQRALQQRLHLQPISVDEFMSCCIQGGHLTGLMTTWKWLLYSRWLTLVSHDTAVFNIDRIRATDRRFPEDGFSALLDAAGPAVRTPAVAAALAAGAGFMAANRTFYSGAANRKAAEAPKCGVTITSPEYPSMWPQPATFPRVCAGETVAVPFTIRNGGAESVTLRYVRPAAPVPEFSLSDAQGVATGLLTSGLRFPPDGAYEVNLTVAVPPLRLGYLRVVIHFGFEAPDGTPFVIGRWCSARVHDPEVDALRPTARYVRPPKRQYVDRRFQHVEPGQRRPMPFRAAPLRKIGQYLVPEPLRAVMRSGRPPGPDAVAGGALAGSLTDRGYASRFSTLLYLEELQMEEDIERYTMPDARLIRAGRGYLSLDVPGLAERRPSLMVGDAVHARGVGAGGAPVGPTYEGCVHRVERESVNLMFSRRFHEEFVSGMTFEVRFTFNRIGLRRAHEALAHLPSTSALFPEPLGPAAPAASGVGGSLGALIAGIRGLNMREPIKGNDKQQLAVVNILAGASGSQPYVVFGPPGTGKTTTVCEAIRHVLKSSRDVKILCACPSNNAADEFILRLKATVPRSEMFRLNAFGRKKGEDALDNFLEYCSYDDEAGGFSVPLGDTLRRFRVIVVTCCSAALLRAAGVPENHFTHVFIDEAGHCIEPDALIPITVAGPKARIILSGDPKQLGPIVRSDLCKDKGLAMSYLERITQRVAYCPRPGETGEGDGRDPRLITMLVDNYRSHPAILDLPSRLFYEGRLVPMADPLDRASLCSWAGLKNDGNRDFPLLFQNVDGQDMQEGNSPSFFNPEEVVTIKRLIESLLQAPRGLGVNLTQIGVIAPYVKQCQKIRLALGSWCPSVEVGSVEAYQGREKRIIIISTTRARSEFRSYDELHSLGFLSNPKRFNVAVTRAKALLIVVGKASLLQHDAHWGALLRHCIANGAYQGPPLPQATQETEETGGDAATTVADDDHREAREEPEWRLPE